MKPLPNIPLETWERLSALQDGELPAGEAQELANDPAMAAPIAALRAQTGHLGARIAAPAGFADRVTAAVEHEPIPANRPWWRRAETVFLAVAAAAVLWMALQPVTDPLTGPAPAQVGPPARPPREAAAPPPEALPPVAPSLSEAPAPEPYGKSEPRKVVEDTLANPPAPTPPLDLVSEAPPAPDPEPAWVRPAGYSLAAHDASVVARLPEAAARLGAHLEDADGNPISADALRTYDGAVFLTIPSDRLQELDAELTRIGAVSAWRDTEQLVGDTLQVQINVELR